MMSRGLPIHFTSSVIGNIKNIRRDEQCPPQYLEQINDILTQVASNLDSGKNAAHAILYECVKTIFAIQSDQSSLKSWG